LTKSNVTAIPKNFINATYDFKNVRKSNQLYNSTQPVFVKSPEKILSVDEKYFKNQGVDKNIK
jgi:hypothetical protein